MPSRPNEIILLPKQEILVLVIILFAATIDTQDYVQEPDTTRKITKLEDQIRRQLMKDNYDYLPSEEDALHAGRAEQDTRAEADGGGFGGREDRENREDREDQKDREDGRGRDDGPQLTTTTDDDDFMIPTMPDSSKHKHKNKEKPDLLGSIMSRKDLLYYIDDKRMMRADHMNDNDVNNTSEGSDVEFDDIIDATKPDAKYKMIKVKEGEPTRRKSPYRRFIQESNREGYSIIRLDDQPFPAFQLPRARRQYMGGADSADGDGPLPDRASDLSAAVAF